MAEGHAAVTDLVPQMRALGVKEGGVLLVHTAYSRVRPVADGPRGVIDALRIVLGPEGTLVMPSMSDDDERPFDPASTPCPGMGIVAETFWRLPGVLRSDSPHAFAAVGPRAPEIVRPHPPDFPHGLDSPVGRVWEMDGQVLLLGVDHTANTTIHLAEALAGVRYRRAKHLVVLEEGRRKRIDYEEIDHCCEKFALLDDWLAEAGGQEVGPVGSARARLVSSRGIVEVVTGRLAHEETVFLHSPGHDAECDEAWRSLDSRPG